MSESETQRGPTGCDIFEFEFEALRKEGIPDCQITGQLLFKQIKERHPMLMENQKVKEYLTFVERLRNPPVQKLRALADAYRLVGKEQSATNIGHLINIKEATGLPGQKERRAMNVNVLKHTLWVRQQGFCQPDSRRQQHLQKPATKQTSDKHIEKHE